MKTLKYLTAFISVLYSATIYCQSDPKNVVKEYYSQIEKLQGTGSPDDVMNLFSNNLVDIEVEGGVYGYASYKLGIENLYKTYQKDNIDIYAII